MTTIDEARAAIYEEFLDQWGTTTPLALEGRAFSEPPPGVSWARLSMRNLGGGQSTLGDAGARIFRREASVFVQVFTPVNAGMAEGATLAQSARAILEARRIGGVELYDGVVNERPLAPGDKNAQINVEVRCTYDETK